MADEKHKKQEKSVEEISRREFIKITGTIIMVSGFGGCIIPGSEIPVSTGYILVDSKKCQGCASCMLACSLVHEGVENLSLSRIQVLQNSFEKWPNDKQVKQCRQCVKPACVEVCPTGALHADPKNGNVRLVDYSKCIGDKLCIAACPYTPGRSIWNFVSSHAQKCDLCVNTPYHWDEGGGGPDGKKACVEVCPVEAIKFTKQVPDQQWESSYEVNLRGESWEKLGYPTTD